MLFDNRHIYLKRRTAYLRGVDNCSHAELLRRRADFEARVLAGAIWRARRAQIERYREAAARTAYLNARDATEELCEWWHDF